MLRVCSSLHTTVWRHIFLNAENLPGRKPDVWGLKNEESNQPSIIRILSWQTPSMGMYFLSSKWKLLNRELISCLFRKHTLYFRQIWAKAENEIRHQLYSGNPSSLTASPSYNWAYLEGESPQIREKLFSSYEQIDNKNTKNWNYYLILC